MQNKDKKSRADYMKSYRSNKKVKEFRVILSATNHQHLVDFLEKKENKSAYLLNLIEEDYKKENHKESEDKKMNYKYDLVAVLLPEDKWHNEKTIYSESFKTKMDTVKMFWTISNAISTKERNHDYFESDQAEIVLNKDYDKMFKEFVKKHSNKDYDEMDSAECDDILFKFDNYYDDLINNKIAKLTLEETIEICNKLAEQRNMKIEFRVELYIQDSNALDDFETLYYCTDDLDLEPYNNSIPYDIFYNFYHYEKTGYIANHFPILDNYN